MKTLLTLIVCGNSPESEISCDGVEFIYYEKDETEKDFLLRAAKSAKGKYAVICDLGVTVADVQPLLNIIDKNSADLICFTGGNAFKTSVLKSCVKDCVDSFSCRVLSVFGCKTLLKTVYSPFIFKKTSGKFTEVNAEGLLYCAETFSSVKAKLPKEIYSFAFNLICDRLVQYYVYAMLAIKDGTMQAETLVSFDSKLKAEIVLFLAFEKRFTYGKLSKLRNKGFRISPLTARKFRKIIK